MLPQATFFLTSIFSSNDEANKYFTKKNSRRTQNYVNRWKLTRRNNVLIRSENFYTHNLGSSVVKTSHSETTGSRFDLDRIYTSKTIEEWKRSKEFITIPYRTNACTGMWLLEQQVWLYNWICFRQTLVYDTITKLVILTWSILSCNPSQDKASLYKGSLFVPM